MSPPAVANGASRAADRSVAREGRGGWIPHFSPGRKERSVTQDVTESLDRLPGLWTQTEEGGAVSPTQHFIWARACADAFHEQSRLQTFVANRGPGAAIASLVRAGGKIPQLESVGVRELFEPTDFVYSSPQALSALTDQLARQPLPLLFQRVPAESPTVDALTKSFSGRGVVHTAPSNPCPYITLDASWAEPEQRFNSGRRSDFRRAQRHAEKLGALVFEVRSPKLDELEPLLDEALAVEALSWKGAEGSALACDPVRARFFRLYARAAAEKGILRMVFMRIAGRAVGMQIALECNQRFWLLKIGHDESVSKCSPGTLLMLHSVRYAASRGLLSYEMLGGVAPWTDTWTKTLRSCVVVRAYPFSAAGMAALGRDAGQWMIRRIERRLRQKEA